MGRGTRDFGSPLKAMASRLFNIGLRLIPALLAPSCCDLGSEEELAGLEYCRRADPTRDPPSRFETDCSFFSVSQLLHKNSLVARQPHPHFEDRPTRLIRLPWLPRIAPPSPSTTTCACGCPASSLLSDALAKHLALLYVRPTHAAEGTLSVLASAAYELTNVERAQFRKPWDVEVVLKPVYLGGVMVAAGNKPPAQVVNKGERGLGSRTRLS